MVMLMLLVQPIYVERFWSFLQFIRTQRIFLPLPSVSLISSSVAQYVELPTIQKYLHGSHSKIVIETIAMTAAMTSITVISSI